MLNPSVLKISVLTEEKKSKNSNRIGIFPLFLFVLLFSQNTESRPLFYKEKPSSLELSLKGKKKDFLRPIASRGLHLKSFPVIYKPEVKRWIDFFSQQSPSYMKLWLKRSYRYFPIMEEIFQSRGLPKELLSMSLVESSLSPKAVSSAQAEGYWQFIKPTGLEFGLRINSWIDERRDFQRSTQAAAKYLYRLYEEFEDWLLSMSAYNMGEARLKRLIKKYGTKNFWILYKKADFPRETALYVPKVLAAAHVIKKPELYGLTEFSVLRPYDYDIFFLSGGTDLRKMSLDTKISLTEIKALNPGLKKEVIPSHIASHRLRIPKGLGFRISRWLDKQQKAR